MENKNLEQEMNEYEARLTEVLHKRGKIARALYDRLASAMPSVYGTGYDTRKIISAYDNDRVNEMIRENREVRSFDSTIDNLQARIKTLYWQLHPEEKFDSEDDQ